MTFLLVGGDGDFATRVQEALESRRHGCLTAKDVDEARWTVELARIDAMALDVGEAEERVLGWVTELALAGRRLSARCLLLAPPPLKPGLLMRAAACGARVLEKPVEVAALMEALVERARRPRRRRARADRTVPEPPLDDLDEEN